MNEETHREVLLRQREVTVETLGRVATQLVAYERAYHFNIGVLINLNDQLRALDGTGNE